MRPADEGSSWLSAHVAHPGGSYTEAGDDVVREVVWPFVERLRSDQIGGDFFFVRYRDQQAHVRLRLRVERGRLDDVADRLVAFVRAVPRRRGGAEGGDAGPVVLDVSWVPYTPEVQRYGGARGVAIAERVFVSSSEASVSLLRGVAGRDRSVRLGRAVVALVLLLAAFTECVEDAVRLADLYDRGYRETAWGGLQPPPDAEIERQFENAYARQSDTLARVVREAWACCVAGEGLPPELESYRVALHQARRELRDAGLMPRPTAPTAGAWSPQLLHILLSYAHMHNNRLGVTPAEESYVGYLVARALTRAGERLPAQSRIVG